MKIEVPKNALKKTTAQSVGVKKDIQARGFRLSFFKANWPDHHV